MSYNDISIKCEALGDAYDAPVIAIGARAFDRETGKLYAKFYTEVQLDSAIRSGRVSGASVARWINRNERARKVFEKADDQKPPLATALYNMALWCRGDGKDSNNRVGPLFMWTGAVQDGMWIEHALTVGGHGLSRPWNLTAVRDVSTLVEAAMFTGFNPKRAGTPSGSAVEDASDIADLVARAWMHVAKSAKPSTPADDPDEL